MLMPTVRVSPETLRQLHRLAGTLHMWMEKRVSLDETIRFLLQSFEQESKILPYADSEMNFECDESCFLDFLEKVMEIFGGRRVILDFCTLTIPRSEVERSRIDERLCNILMDEGVPFERDDFVDVHAELEIEKLMNLFRRLREEFEWSSDLPPMTLEAGDLTIYITDWGCLQMDASRVPADDRKILITEFLRAHNVDEKVALEVVSRLPGKYKIILRTIEGIGTLIELNGTIIFAGGG